MAYFRAAAQPAASTPERIGVLLVYGAILPRGPLRTLRKFRALWKQESSALLVFCRQLTAKLGVLLQRRIGANVRVALALNDGNPSIDTAVKELAEQNVRRLLVLTLCPEAGSASTRAVFDSTSRVLQRWRWLPETRFVMHGAELPRVNDEDRQALVLADLVQNQLSGWICAQA